MKYQEANTQQLTLSGNAVSVRLCPVPSVHRAHYHVKANEPVRQSLIPLPTLDHIALKMLNLNPY